jgi:hypothetical protein
MKPTQAKPQPVPVCKRSDYLVFLGMRGLVQHVVLRDLLQPVGWSLQAGCSRSMLCALWSWD